MSVSSQTSLPALGRERPGDAERALLALGCFWTPDARFGAHPGVVRTSSGYTGGTTAAPTYRDLGDHTEAVEVVFDPEVLSYEELLEVFWESHDPTRKPWKRQYRSALFVLDDAQEAAAHRSRARAAEKLDARIRTAIEPAGRFHLAEPYHQNHRLRQHDAFERVYEMRCPAPDASAHSAAASRVNGYLGGCGSAQQLEREIGWLKLPKDLQAELRRRHAQAGSRRAARQELPG